MQQSQPLLRLDSIGKDYPKLETRAGRLKLVIDLVRGRAARSVFRALDDVTLSVASGESLGIVGENGAGKSTLLKIIAGVVKPTRGSLQVRGRVGALLELGSGFNPEFSGRENVYLNGAILGFSARQMDQKYKEITEFAEIGDFIHQPNGSSWASCMAPRSITWSTASERCR